MQGQYYNAAGRVTSKKAMPARQNLVANTSPNQTMGIVAKLKLPIRRHISSCV
jgi:hypothetical protein